jgi:hypothetical protein
MSACDKIMLTVIDKINGCSADISELIGQYIEFTPELHFTYFLMEEGIDCFMVCWGNRVIGPALDVDDSFCPFFNLKSTIRLRKK